MHPGGWGMSSGQENPQEMECVLRVGVPRDGAYPHEVGCTLVVVRVLGSGEHPQEGGCP